MHLSDYFLELFTFVRFLTDSDEMTDAEYEVVRSDVSGLIEKMEHKVAENGVDRNAYYQARFAVFAWVDERILCSDWSGTRDWLKKPLQREYYKTANAGEEFFERLKVLLDGSGVKVDESLFADLDVEAESPLPKGSGSNSEILEVYTLCLSLGFTGAYFNDSDADHLDKFKEDCLNRIVDRQNQNVEEIFPQAYSGVLHKKGKPEYNRFFNPALIVFFLLPLVVMAGIYFSYNYLLEEAFRIWLG